MPWPQAKVSNCSRCSLAYLARRAPRETRFVARTALAACVVHGCRSLLRRREEALRTVRARSELNPESRCRRVRLRPVCAAVHQGGSGQRMMLLAVARTPGHSMTQHSYISAARCSFQKVKSTSMGAISLGCGLSSACAVDGVDGDFVRESNANNWYTCFSQPLLCASISHYMLSLSLRGAEIARCG